MKSFQISKLKLVHHDAFFKENWYNNYKATAYD